MNIHVIANCGFAEKFVWFIDEMYPYGTNIIYICDNYDKPKSIRSDNIVYIDNYKYIDFSKLNSKDKLFIHGFYDASLVRFLYCHRFFFSKDQLVLIIWGADLYNARHILSKPGLHLKVRINEIIKRKLVHYSNKFMTFACADYDLICDWYGAKGKQYDCIYPTNANVDVLDKLKNNKQTGDTVILLGNSATVTNQHVPALDQLSVFVNENIRIICPLSYGDMKYADEISDYGNRLFGKKFVPIKEFLNVEDYSKLLNTVDIAVFYNNRQQATGNIEILAYLRKKIFIRSDTTTWKHYVERDGCRFYDALKIASMEFDDFIFINENDYNYNKSYIKGVWDTAEIKKLWDQVMEA